MASLCPGVLLATLVLLQDSLSKGGNKRPMRRRATARVAGATAFRPTCSPQEAGPKPQPRRERLTEQWRLQQRQVESGLHFGAEGVGAACPYRGSCGGCGRNWRLRGGKTSHLWDLRNATANAVAGKVQHGGDFRVPARYNMSVTYQLLRWEPEYWNLGREAISAAVKRCCLPCHMQPQRSLFLHRSVGEA